MKQPEGNAVVFCEGAFQNTYGKTAHGLVRFTERYKVAAVVDSTCGGMDSGEVLDGAPNGIPVYSSVNEAFVKSAEKGLLLNYMVVGIAPDGGGLSEEILAAADTAVGLGLNVDCGLHEFLNDNMELKEKADRAGVVLRDIRKTPPRKELHPFSGRISSVGSVRIAVLGTDSAIGKRTTAWLLVHELNRLGKSVELIGTGQTAWMQGAEYSIILDSLINDFVSGEIENAVVRAWEEKKPDYIIIEGQGSLMNPAYPGGFEILAAARPDGIILQHAPGRSEYDGFPGYPLHPLEQQIHAVEFLSGKPVIAVTVNHEGLKQDETAEECRKITELTGLPAVDPLTESPYPVAEAVLKLGKGGTA